MTLRTTTVPARQIEPGLVAEWQEILRARPDLASPFFRPEYTLMVAACRPGVFVTVARQGSEVMGIFPFERHARMPVGDPVGAGFADYHGLIAPPGSPWTLRDAVRASGLGVWRFATLRDAAGDGERWAVGADTSWIIDVSGGFEAYDAWAAARSRQYKRLARKARRMHKDLGPVRFDLRPPDDGLVDHVIAAKRRQYADTGVPDALRPGWTRELMRSLARTDTPEFGGLAATLRAGDLLLAVDLGMRSREGFHSWLPIMDRDYRSYSPGHVLLKLTAEAVANRGMRFVDLGWGDGSYKERFANATVTVHRGTVLAPSVVGTTWGMGSAAAEWMRGSPLHGPARLLKHVASTAAQGAAR
ncbi:MAG: GNAT family N-acetyltransferase [Miltoncostaeaceae bacterium]